MVSTAPPRSITTELRELADHLGMDGLLAFTPPGMAYVVARYIAAPERHVESNDLEARDPAFLAYFMRYLRALGDRYFRLTVHGTEHLPREGKALLVGSHNGGIVVTDSLFTILAVWDKFGEDRRLYSLSHDILHGNPTTRRLASKAGILRAGHAGAAEALRAGHLALVYPGSDLDTMRPFKDRYRFVLGNRRGFIRLALREGAPIIPVASVGTHEQFVVLTRGDALAKALRVKSWLRSEAFPIVLSVPWGITSGYMPYVPLPAQTSIAFGPPIDLGYPKEAAEDPDVVDACAERVRLAVQHELEGLAKDRVPFLGKRPRSPR